MPIVKSAARTHDGQDSNSWEAVVTHEQNQFTCRLRNWLAATEAATDHLFEMLDDWTASSSMLKGHKVSRGMLSSFKVDQHSHSVRVDCKGNARV